MEKISIDGRIVPTINGGHGSGNFGHSGRPGEVGGSAPSGSGATKWSDIKAKQGKAAIDYVYDNPRGKYSDGFDVLESAKEHLVDKIGDWEEISEAYEDDARDFLDLPSREEEQEGKDLYMSDLVNIQDRIAEVIREKSLDDMKRDLGTTTVESALDFGLDKGGYEFASKNAELGQAGLSHDDAVRDLKSFIVDFGIKDHYGAVKAAEDGDLKTAWQNISYDMRDKLKDEYDYDPVKENALKNATCNVVLPPEQMQNGGKGSGNFGHSGRPGEVGGSGTGKGASEKPASEGGDTKYSSKSGADSRKLVMERDADVLNRPDQFGLTYDELGKPIRISRFEKEADDKLWGAWAAMQKVADDQSLGDVTKDGLSTAHQAKKLAKAIVTASQTYYMGKDAAENTDKLAKQVKEAVKKQKLTLTADSKKYGDNEVRKATRQALDDISSAMSGFLGFDKKREYKD